MTDAFDLPEVIPIPARYCASKSCSKKLAALNRGKYCYTCSDERNRVAAARDGMSQAAPGGASAAKRAVPPPPMPMPMRPRLVKPAVHSPILDTNALRMLLGGARARG